MKVWGLTRLYTNCGWKGDEEEEEEEEEELVLRLVRSSIVAARVSTGSQEHRCNISSAIKPSHTRPRIKKGLGPVCKSAMGIEKMLLYSKLTSSRNGKTPNTNELLNTIGKNSPSFHTPHFVSPTTCPILNTLALAPISIALATTCSPTNLLLAYPVAETALKLFCKASGILDPAVAFKATETELAKKNFAGEGRLTFMESERRLWRPRICVSKDFKGRLKFTGQAMWITSANSRLSNENADGDRLKVG